MIEDVSGVLLGGGEVIRFHAVMDVRRTTSELILDVASGGGVRSTLAFPIDDVVGILIEEDSRPGGWSKFGRGALGFFAGVTGWLILTIFNEISEIQK